MRGDIPSGAGDRGEGCYYRLFENSLDAVLLTLPDGTIVDANPAAQRMFGMTGEELRAAGSDAIIVQDGRLQAALEERSQRGATRAVLNCRRKDGSALTEEATMSAFTDQDGTVMVGVIMRSIDDPMQAATSLEEGDRIFHLMFDNLQEAVALFRYVLDENGEVTDWRYAEVNHAYERALGLPRGSIIGSTVMQLLGPEAMAEYLPIVRALRTEKRPAMIRSHFAPLDLEILNYIASVNEDMFVISSLDISGLERLKKELARSNDELEEYAYVASHSLKEPLRMVRSHLLLLEKKLSGRLDGDGMEHLRFAVDGAERMTGMIDDLLAYSRLEVKEKDLRRIPMEEVLGSVLRDLKASIDESGALVSHASLPTITADEAQMGLLLANLLSNAIKYRAEAAPHIIISARREGSEWLFSVQDNGIGIDPKHADKLFKMFSRLHTRDEYPGTGIGLAVAKKIVERHHGRIWFESEPGKGTTFYFTLPAPTGVAQ